MRGKKLQQFIEENADSADWFFLSQHKNFKTLPISFVWEFREEWNWREISYCQKNLSEEFIDTFADYVYWDTLIFSSRFSEKLLRKHSDKIKTWHSISYAFKLSPEFIDEFAHKLDWLNMARSQKIPESLLRKYSHLFGKDEWYWISAK